MNTKAVFNWSGGKDSALALHKVLNSREYDIQKLLTSVSKKYNRITMHGVRYELLKKQAEALNIPLQTMLLPEDTEMTTYNELMRKTMLSLIEDGYSHSIFGDIFLEDLRKYREEKLNEVQMKAVFPLWKTDTTQLIHEFLDLGFKTIIVSANNNLLGEDFTGEVITKELIKSLPKNVDPCGENGEFHTFVFDGPIFSKPIEFEIGEKTLKTYPSPNNQDENCFADNPQPETIGFSFCDLKPKNK